MIRRENSSQMLKKSPWLKQSSASLHSFGCLTSKTADVCATLLPLVAQTVTLPQPFCRPHQSASQDSTNSKAQDDACFMPEHHSASPPCSFSRCQGSLLLLCSLHLSPRRGDLNFVLTSCSTMVQPLRIQLILGIWQCGPKMCAHDKLCGAKVINPGVSW